MNNDLTLAQLSSALDAVSLRQLAIAHNIATQTSVNSKKLELNTESNQLQETQRQTTLEEQMALNVQNMTHYRALIAGLNRHFALMQLAIEGGNN